MTAPLRKIIQRDYRPGLGGLMETLECGHLCLPKPHPYFPDRYLEPKRRRCQKCAAEQAERERVLR